MTPTQDHLEQLHEMAEVHVTYEVRVLRRWSTWAPLDPVLNQATSEVALLHCRVVTEFLTARRHVKPDDLIALDYFDRGWARPPTVLLAADDARHKATMTELHKRLAHLTLRRLMPFSWEGVFAHIPGVLDAFDAFRRDLAAVHPDRATWFASA